MASDTSTNPVMNVTLVGGGNSTHVFAGLLASKGHNVTIFTRRPEDWKEEVVCENQDPGWLEDQKEIGGKIKKISKNPGECIPEADMIVLAGLPVHLYRDVLKTISPFVKRKGIMIGSLCAYGGFLWLVNEALGEHAPDVCVFGTQSIPWTCGTLNYGSRGVVFGAKRHLHIAFENEPVCTVAKDPLQCLQKLLMLPLCERTDFITCTLWPNNPLFHPTVLWGLFADWDMKTPYKESDVPKMIYAEVTRKSADTMQKMDDEMQSITKAVRKIYPDNRYLDMAKPLRDCLVFHYKELITDPTDLYSILRTNKAYSKHKITYKKVGDGMVIPDVTHKFFTTDLPYGLCIYKDLALTLGVETPMIDTLIYWNQKMVSKEFMVDGKLCGKDIGEAVIPSKFGGFGKAGDKRKLENASGPDAKKQRVE